MEQKSDRTFTEWLRFVEGRTKIMYDGYEMTFERNSEFEEKGPPPKIDGWIINPNSTWFKQMDPDFKAFQENMKRMTEHYNNKN